MSASFAQPGSSDAEDWAALEELFVDNDALRELEEAIGRFNIFDALGIARTEIRHSRFLAWLLTPTESHGQGGLFLRALLMDLLKQTPPARRPLSPVALDGVDFRDVDIRREWQGIDLLIACKTPPLVVAIENKVDSGEHSDQLRRYRTEVAKHFPNHRALLVFLTVTGDEPSDDCWMRYTYGDIHRVLDRCRYLHEGSIDDNVRVFLEHYLNLIEGRFMANPELDSLCEAIYANHRRALDLIFARRQLAGSGLVGKLAVTIDHLHDETRWRVFNQTTKEVWFLPRPWENMLPPVGSRPRFDRRFWLVFRARVDGTKCYVGMVAWRTTDRELRRKVIRRLTQDRKEFGLRVFSEKTAGDQWTWLGRWRIDRWQEDHGPDHGRLVRLLTTQLDELWPIVSQIPSALQPLVGKRPGARSKPNGSSR